MQILFFDTETTGFPRKLSSPLETQPEIFEFAGAILDTKNLEKEPERFTFLCRTQKKLPTIVEDYCHIKDSELNGKPPFSYYYKELENFISKCDGWVAHNLIFDKKMLAIELARLGKHKTFPWPKIERCTMQWSRKNCARGKHNLRDLHYRYAEENVIQGHRAMSDVDMLIAVARVLISEGTLSFEENEEN